MTDFQKILKFKLLVPRPIFFSIGPQSANFHSFSTARKKLTPKNKMKWCSRFCMKWAVKNVQNHFPTHLGSGEIKEATPPFYFETHCTV